VQFQQFQIPEQFIVASLKVLLILNVRQQFRQWKRIFDAESPSLIYLIIIVYLSFNFDALKCLLCCGEMVVVEFSVGDAGEVDWPQNLGVMPFDIVLGGLNIGAEDLEACGRKPALAEEFGDSGTSRLPRKLEIEAMR
jgi:hypothetical protein